MLSYFVYLHLFPIMYALLRILKCDSVAAFGLPVVPEVNCMFTGSFILTLYFNNDD
jgi:hypothetical protein